MATQRASRTSRTPASAGRAAPAGRPSFEDAFHRTIVDNIADGVYYVDRDRVITYWNHGAERLTGYDAADVIGRACYSNILAHVDDAGRALCRDGCPLTATLGDGSLHEADVWLRHADGHRRPVRVRVAPVRDDEGTVIGAVEVFDDASRYREAREAAAQARKDALTDPLTGIANRRHFDAALAARLADLQRYGRPFGLLIADIDHFKAVNDRFGHDVGDVALRVVAGSLAGGVRAGDHVSRWGGEEFAILVAAGSLAELGVVAERLRVLVARSQVRRATGPFGVRISLGGTLATAADDPASLIMRADAGLYRAKTGGRDRTELVDATERGGDVA